MKKKLKGASELGTFAALGRSHGYPVKTSKSGGGWINVALACGGENIQSKPEARDFLRLKFKGIKPVFKPTASRVKTNSVASDAFLLSFAWRKLRMEALIKYGRRCVCCGATPMNGAVMNVDHIKPRKLFPQLALDINNLQILCGECNHGKGNWDQTDWREK